MSRDDIQWLLATGALNQIAEEVAPLIGKAMNPHLVNENKSLRTRLTASEKSREDLNAKLARANEALRFLQQEYEYPANGLVPEWEDAAALRIHKALTPSADDWLKRVKASCLRSVAERFRRLTIDGTKGASKILTANEVADTLDREAAALDPQPEKSSDKAEG